jgi:hypothetical protein
LSSGVGEFVLGAMGPGDVLVVNGVAAETAVKEPDEAVSEGS